MKNDSTQFTYFLYPRKSTDEKDRQVLSLESQIAEVKKRFPDIKLIELPGESGSAFEPYKRPIFADMMKRLKKGEAQGIIAWHPDRLSRNAIEAAEIIYALDKGVIKDLKFCSYFFHNSPEGKMMLQIALSQSKYSSDKLSVDVWRGLEAKLDKGWRPGTAPFGYLNEPNGTKGEKRVLKDPERFSLVRQMWDLMLTGTFSPFQILTIANNEWGFRTRTTKKHVGRPMSLSGIYKIFSNPFYYGEFEYPKGSGLWYKGSHEPMITREEYKRVQKILGRPDRPRQQVHSFPFTGLIRCGECGKMITAERKRKVQKNGNIHHYIYYHCSKQMKSRCHQPSIERRELERQIIRYLNLLQIEEQYKNWAIKHLQDLDDQDEKDQITIHQNLQKKYKETENNLSELTKMRYSAEIDKEEFDRERSHLKIELAKLQDELNKIKCGIEEDNERCERAFNFARNAQYWFLKGDNMIKKSILETLGSNLSLTGKNLLLKPKKGFQIIGEGQQLIQLKNMVLEPSKSDLPKTKSPAYNDGILLLSRIVKEARTHFRKNVKDYYPIPNFDEEDFGDLRLVA